MPRIPKKIINKSYRILALSLLILIGAITFVVWRLPKETVTKDPTHDISQFYVEPITPGFVGDTSGGGSSRTPLPPPAQLKHFDYSPSLTELDIQDKCSAAYYTILIYNAADDYRYNPSVNKFNQAFVCATKGAVEQKIILKNLNLTPGTYYYLVADQGTTGVWYNPR